MGPALWGMGQRIFLKEENRASWHAIGVYLHVCWALVSSSYKSTSCTLNREFSFFTNPIHLFIHFTLSFLYISVLIASYPFCL